jgi:glycerophosphoryl diester phosphodiesterase
MYYILEMPGTIYYYFLQHIGEEHNMKNNHLFLLALLLVVASVVQLSASTKIIAHRGASSVAPQNTLAAFQKAADFNADYFELDVQLSADDSLMIMHDKAVNQTTDGSGFLAFLTYAQLREFDAGSWFDPLFTGEKIPTLKEALLLGKENDIKVCIEIKATKVGIVEKIIDLVEKLGMEQQVIIFSFDIGQITLAKKLNPTIPVLYLMNIFLAENIDMAAAINAQAIGIGGSIDADQMDYCRQNNIEIWMWTINDAVEMNALMTLGVDGIITDYPQLLTDVKVVEQSENNVADFRLLQNYPNPFNPKTTIVYSIPSTFFVELSIYNSLGKKVRSLIHTEQNGGVHQASWDGYDELGKLAASGVYFYQLKAGENVKHQRMILAR